MSKQVSDNQKMAGQIEEVVNSYLALKENTENEIAKLRQQLLETGLPGSTIVKLKPVWHNDALYLLRKEIENLNTEISKKAV